MADKVKKHYHPGMIAFIVFLVLAFMVCIFRIDDLEHPGTGANCMEDLSCVQEVPASTAAIQGGYFECSQYINITKWFILPPGQIAAEVKFPGELRNLTNSMWCDVSITSGWVWYDSSNPQKAWFEATNCVNKGDSIIALNWSVSVCAKETFVRYPTIAE